MKKLISPALLLAFIQFPGSAPAPGKSSAPLPVNKNLIIITLDGFRWQEFFTGADSVLLHDAEYTQDVSTLRLLYWSPDPGERRKKLMPFVWNVLAEKGQLFGNRLLGNRMNVSNRSILSYPGYNEIFTGKTDPRIISNRKLRNPNIHVLEYLESQPGFAGQVAVFSSWDAFPFILDDQRNGVYINSGHQAITGDDVSPVHAAVNRLQERGEKEETAIRHDMLTFLAAREYLSKQQPRVLYLALGETDEAAHDGRYDIYLEKANQADKMIAEIWHWVQTTAGYRDNTSLVITTDHGRGARPGKWTSHGTFISGSAQTWLAIMGPGISPAGEINEPSQHYQAQLAQTISALLGEDFAGQYGSAAPVSLR